MNRAKVESSKPSRENLMSCLHQIRAGRCGRRALDWKV